MKSYVRKKIWFKSKKSYLNKKEKITIFSNPGRTRDLWWVHYLPPISAPAHRACNTISLLEWATPDFISPDLWLPKVQIWAQNVWKTWNLVWGSGDTFWHSGPLPVSDLSALEALFATMRYINWHLHFTFNSAMCRSCGLPSKGTTGMTIVQHNFS